MKFLFPGYGVRLGGDLNELRRHHRIVQSTNQIFIDDLKEAWRFKQEFPQTEVAHRWETLERDIPEKITGEQWLNNRLADYAIMGIPNDQIVIHTSNEPNLTKEIIQWHIDYYNAVLTFKKKPRSLLLNFAVGQPAHELIPLLRELLKIIVEHPDLFYVGLHEYAPLVWTAGVNGTAPPGWNAKYKPEAPALEYPIKPEEWFTTIFNNACWFMGRFRFWAEFCHREFKKLPNFWISEYGFDDVKDVEWWQQSQPRTILDPKTQKPKRLAGWKLLEAVWRLWWPQWSHEQALWEQVKASIPVVYEAEFIAFDGTHYLSPVKHITFFGWSPMKWEDFDLSLAKFFLSLFEQYVIGLNSVPTKPIVQFVPKPDNAKFPQVIRLKTARKGRSGPGSHYTEDADLPAGSVITLYDIPVMNDGNGGNWKWGDITATRGSWFSTTGLFFDIVSKPADPPTQEMPVVTVPAPTTPPPVNAEPVRKDRVFQIVVTATDQEAADIATNLLRLINAVAGFSKLAETVNARIVIQDMSVKEAQLS